MIGYIKLKTTNQELYETDYLKKLKEKSTKIAHWQYLICYVYFEFVVWIKYIGNMITVKKIYHAYLFILPFEIKEGKRPEYKLKVCIKKIQKLIKRYEINTIVLSEELEEGWISSVDDLIKEQQKTMQNFNYQKQKKRASQLNWKISRKVKVLEGKGLMLYLIKEILEYIMEKQNTKPQLEDIYVCIKETKTNYIENIRHLAQYFKTVNIITPNITKFQKIADKIEENQNSIITVINNKKKSLKKAQWIINFDFTKEEMKKYAIFRRSVILEIKEDGEYDNICFEGALIQKAKIDVSTQIKEFFEKYHLLGNCSLEALYESLINERQDLTKVKEQMQQDEIRVVKLCGRNVNFM